MIKYIFCLSNYKKIITFKWWKLTGLKTDTDVANVY